MAKLEEHHEEDHVSCLTAPLTQRPPAPLASAAPTGGMMAARSIRQ